MNYNSIVKMNVAIVMGGYTDEAVISLRSGQLLLQKIDTTQYTPFEIHIVKEGWYCLLNEKKYPIDRSDFSVNTDQQKIKFDVVLNTIHGTPGEDGHLQAYWELIDLPYAGCNYYQSALTFNKRDTLSVLSKFDIPKANSIYLTKGDTISLPEIVAELGYPFFVKPNQSGSSLGVSKVKNESEFEKAIHFAFEEDNEILIESFLSGTEISVGVLLLNNEITVLGITEIVSENDFFDYEAKYLGKSNEITPARINPEIQETVEFMAKKIYKSLGMIGFSRIDFIIMNEVPHFIEINTNPGLSPQSIFPQQAAHAQIPFSDLIENEIQLALKRKRIWDH